MQLWCARLTWVLLPVSAGGALGDALSGWSTAPARVAAVLLWAAWAVGLMALLAPRLWGLTALRIVAPAAIVMACAAAASTSASSAALAITSCVVAAAFALSTRVAQEAGNSLAYGDEVRFPLRVPTPLLLGPVPLAVALVISGVTAGPLLIADDRVVVGIIVTVIGVPIAYALVRSLHALGSRWLVIVPAGMVVADPFTLTEPVLMRRENITRLEHVREPRGSDATLDLRLGTHAGTIEIRLDAPQTFGRRRGRKDSDLRDTADVLVAPVQVAGVLALAAERRIATV